MGPAGTGVWLWGLIAVTCGMGLRQSVPAGTGAGLQVLAAGVCGGVGQ